MAVGGTLTAIARFIQPALTTGEPGPVGSLTLVEHARAYVGRDARGLYAILAVCTHLGCTPHVDAHAFVCPCDGSRFRRDGTVLNGPATRPLGRVLIGRLANGRLFVDPGSRVDAEYRLSV